MPHPLPKRRPIDAVPIVQQIPRRFVPWKRVHHLLRGPRGGRMLGDVEVDDAPSMVSQDDQDKEHRVSHRGDHQEIQRHQVLHVVCQKGLPRRRR
jgi:hypothetical protein